MRLDRLLPRTEKCTPDASFLQVVERTYHEQRNKHLASVIYVRAQLSHFLGARP